MSIYVRCSSNTNGMVLQVYIFTHMERGETERRLEHDPMRHYGSLVPRARAYSNHACVGGGGCVDK